MAIGDAAQAAGYGLVPEDGENGRVALGAQEINRTRDFLAALKNAIPVGKTAFRTAAGISSSTAAPSGGADGDIHFKVL